MLTRLECVELSDIDRKEPERWKLFIELANISRELVTVDLADLSLLHAGDPLDWVEHHVGVELEAEGELVVAIEVDDA